MTFYKCRVAFEVTFDNGKVKNQNREYIVSAVSVTDAEVKLHTALKNSVEPFEVKTVSETKIVDVIIDG